jgi:hypothetical protein
VFFSNRLSGLGAILTPCNTFNRSAAATNTPNFSEKSDHVSIVRCIPLCRNGPTLALRNCIFLQVVLTLAALM